MSRKDYETAAIIAQHMDSQESVIEAFVRLFRDDSPRFNEDRFRAACRVGANVKARPRRSA